MSFALDHFDARAGFEPLHVQARQRSISLEFRRVKIDAVAGGVCEAIAFQFLDHAQLFADVVCGFAPDRGFKNIEPFEVLAERGCVRFGNLPHAAVFALGADLHFILALILIIGQMPHIGDVHDVAHAESVEEQDAFEHVFEDVRPQVSNVSIMIYCGAAGIQPHCPAAIGSKELFFAHEGVV